MHGLVPWSLQCLFLCVCDSVEQGRYSRGGRGSSHLVTVTQGSPVLSSRYSNHLYETITARATSPPSVPPNRRELIPSSRQEVVILTGLQGTFQ